MKFADIGINENRGGGVLFVTGTVAKNESYSIFDKDTKKTNEGWSFHLAFFGGVLKIKTQDGDPLRNLGEGEEVALKLKISAPKGKAEQLGAAEQLDPKTLQPLNIQTPSSA